MSTLVFFLPFFCPQLFCLLTEWSVRTLRRGFYAQASPTLRRSIQPLLSALALRALSRRPCAAHRERLISGLYFVVQ